MGNNSLNGRTSGNKTHQIRGGADGTSVGGRRLTEERPISPSSKLAKLQTGYER